MQVRDAVGKSREELNVWLGQAPVQRVEKNLNAEGKVTGYFVALGSGEIITAKGHDVLENLKPSTGARPKHLVRFGEYGSTY
jgi:hypothetical protein